MRQRRLTLVPSPSRSACRHGRPGAVRSPALATARDAHRSAGTSRLHRTWRRPRRVGWRMVEPEVFDWDEWENGRVYTLSNDELVGALLSEVSALRKRVKTLEDRQPD